MRSRLKRVLCYFLICTGCSSLFFLGISQDSYDSNVSSAYGGNPANFTFEIVKTLKHLGTGRHVEFLQIPKVKCGLSQELLILVKSTADAFDKREIQRQTWVGEVKHLGIPVVFALGRSLNLTVNQIVSVENRRFGDLLQADFTDKYANLSLKTLATFLWEADCRPAKRLFHTDDDCILLTQNFISFFNRSQADLQSETILGHCWNRSKVVRDPNNTKSFLSNETFPPWFFPKYCSGTGFFLTSDVPEKLLAVLDDRKLLKRFGHLDDVLYTGILPQKGNISRLHTENVRFEAKTYVKPCDRQTFAMHGYKPPSVYKHYWNLYRKTMKGCRITAAGSFALRENTGVFSLPSYSGAIWTYWPDSEIPPLVQLAFDSVSCLNSHHFSHIILTPNNISEYYNGKMLENQRLHRSFISVHLLNRFGGFYLEPNTVARRSFVKLFRRLQGTTEGCLITQGGKYAGLIGPFRANSSITSQWLEGVLKGAISSTFVDFILEDKKLTTKLSCNDVFDRKSLIQDEAYTDYLDTSYTEAKLNGTKDQAKNSDKDIIRLYQSCCLPKERKCGRNETSGFVMMSKGFSLN